MGRVPIDGCPSRGSGEMAEDTLLQEDWPRACSWEQGQNSQYYERALLARDSVGVGGQESDYQRSSKRKAGEGTRRSYGGGNCGNSGGAAQSSPNDDRTGCIHRITPRRTHRTPLGGRGFRAADSPRPQVGSCDGRGSTENGGVEKRCAVGRANCRVAFRVAPELRIPCSARLGVCIAGDAWQATVLAGHAVAILRQTCPQTGPDYQARELSHVQAHLWNSSEREWREPKGCAGIASSRQSESDHGRLYASCQSAEERSPEQAGEDGHEKDRLIVTGPNSTIRKAAVLRKFFILLASPTGFEPVLPP